jgi:mannose-1-phosphate guanylyltransferase/mannose-1-phosphate guanylyltransferase/mannose-6-phosphate isomerase
MPSDHVIADAAAFRAGVERATGLAQEGWLVTFGIQPSRPETGYGYIQMGEALAPGICRADRFVEKPDLARAQAFLDSGGFAWNAGIFLFQAKALRDALAAHAPDVLAAAAAALRNRREDGRRVHPAADDFGRAPSISIDRAVMEKAERIAVVPLDIGWSDVGSWEALYEVGTRDEQGNVVVGESLLIDSRDCLIHSEGPKVVTIGVHDLVVAVSGGCVLVMPRSESQRVRDVVGLIESGEGAAG